VEELVNLISKGDYRFQVAGKYYYLNLPYERKHEETSASDPDINFFRSANSVTSSAGTPTLENSESREQVNPNFLMPKLRINISPPKSDPNEEPEFDLPKIRIKLDITDEIHYADKALDQYQAVQTDAPDLLEILRGIDKKASQDQIDKDQKLRNYPAYRTSGTLQAVDDLLANGPRHGAVSEKREPVSKMPNIEDAPVRLKKMKSTLPDVGKLKSELQKENELLRQKASGSFEENTV
jgi:hypothetical protein